MQSDSTPWRLPKPHPNAFASTGTLQKKHRPAADRASLPVMATPETPSKKERSKFILPSNISPFALSPRQIEASFAKPPATTPARVPTKLSTSFSHNLQNDELCEHPSSCLGPPTRSSSPVHYGSLMDDIFGTLDTHSNGDEDEGLASVAEEALENSMRLSYDITKLRYPSWKSRSPRFLNSDFFINNDCRQIFFNPSNDADILDPTAVIEDYFEANFEVAEVLGRGSFSDVFRVRRKQDGSWFALKRSRDPFSGVADTLRRLQEVENLWLVSGHPHCLQIYASWEQKGYLYILTELCENGSLSDVIKYMSVSEARFTEYQVWQILLQLASGLDHIHSAGIVHLDVKPANVLITTHGVLKLGDFGLSIRAGGQYDPDMEGDKYYMAPETLENHYDTPADVFSLGLLILELAADVELPSQGTSWQNLRHGDYSELSFDDISDALNHLIREMIDPDPFRRPSVKEISRRAEAFSHRLSQVSGTASAQAPL